MLKYILLFLIFVVSAVLGYYLIAYLLSSSDSGDADLSISEDSKKIGKLDIDKSVKALKDSGYSFDEGTQKKILISLSSMLSLSKEDLGEIAKKLSDASNKAAKKSDDNSSKSEDKDKEDAKGKLYDFNRLIIDNVFGRDDGVKKSLSGSDSKMRGIKKLFESMKSVDTSTEEKLKEIIPDFSKYVSKVDKTVSKHKISEAKISDSSTSEKGAKSVGLSVHVFYCLVKEYAAILKTKEEKSKDGK